MKKKFKKNYGDDDFQRFLESQEIEENSIKEYLKDILFGVSKNEEKIKRINRGKLKRKLDNR